MGPVLLVDDDAGMRAMLRAVLDSLGLPVIEAADGAAGVALFRAHRPSLVITDIVMPEKDGIETVREIRAIDPQARIIAISGGGGRYPNPLGLARALGAAETLEKPFHPKQLRAAVARLIPATV